MSLIRWRPLYITVISIVAVIAIFISALRFYLWQNISHFQPKLEQIVSQQLHAQFRIAHLETGWDGMQPTFRFDGITLQNQQGEPLASLAQGSGRIAWRTLLKLSLRLEQFDLENIQLHGQREQNGKISIAGQPIDLDSQEEMVLPEWLLKSRHITIKQFHFLWHDALNQAAPNTKISIPALRLDKKGHDLRAQFNLETNLLSEPAQFDIHFSPGLLGDIRRWKSWSGQVNWSFVGLDVEKLQHDFSLLSNLRSGTLEGKGKLDFHHGEIKQANSQFNMQFGDLKPNPQGSTLDLRALSGDVSYQYTPTRRALPYQLYIHALNWQYASNNNKEMLQDFVFAWKTKKTSADEKSSTHSSSWLSQNPFQKIKLTTPQLPLTPFMRLMSALPLPQNIQSVLRTTQIKGTLHALALTWEAGNGSPASFYFVQNKDKKPTPSMMEDRYSIEADLQDISFSSTEKSWPELTHLSGKLTADQTQGQLLLTSQDSALGLRDVFDDPLFFSRLEGSVVWQINKNKEGKSNWKISSPNLLFTNLDMTGMLSGSYASDTDQLTLRGRIDKLALEKVAHYIPKQVDASTKTFLTLAKLTGESRHITVNMQGPLKSFPYTQTDRGVFQVTIPVSQGSITIPTSDFLANKNLPKNEQHWPLIKDINGAVTFKQASLYLDFQSAKVYNARLKNVRGEISDLSADAPRLKINGTASGATQDFLNFIQQSPLIKELPIIDGMQTQGNGKLSLLLDLALTHSALGDKISGTYTPFNNQLNLPTSIAANLPPVQALNGTLRFTQETLHLESIKGSFAGGAFTANGSTRAQESIEIQGQATVNALRDIPQVTPFAALLDGTLKYQVHVQLKQGAQHIRVYSDLTDLVLNLPPPLEKIRGQALPTQFIWHSYANGKAEFNLHVGSILRAQYLFSPNSTGLQQITQGGIGIYSPDTATTSSPPFSLPAEGVSASLQLDTLDIDQWHRFLNSLSHDTSASQSTSAINDYLPQRIDAQVNTLKALNRTWEKVNAIITHTKNDKNSAWQAQVDAPQINGTARWIEANASTPAGAIEARFRQLHIPNATPPQTSETSANVNASTSMTQQLDNLPALNLVIDDLQVKGTRFSNVELNGQQHTEKDESQWVLNKLHLQHAAAKLDASGNLSVPKDNSGHIKKPLTAVNFSLAIADGGDLLEALGLPKTLAKTNGKFEGQLQWHSHPFDLDYDSLNGKITLDLQKGVLLRVDSGAAKLLGLFSLNKLLQLTIFDLKGLTAKGTPFDDVKATIKIHQGTAQTEDFLMNSAIATVNMRGNASLKNQTQDLKVEILPIIDFGSAALAYAAIVNPLFGLGSLVAQKILGKSLGQAFAQTYHVTGTWDEPIIDYDSKKPSSSDNKKSSPSK